MDDDEPTCVKAGRSDALLEALSSPLVADSFVAPYLLCMHSLATPSDVLAHLLARHAEQPARVQRVLEMWVSTYWSDFRDHAELRQRLEQFCDERLGVEFDPDRRLRAWIDKMDRTDKGLQTSAQRQRVKHTRPPPPLLQAACVGFLSSALDLHSTEVARQLTLVDEALYKMIEPREATDQAWTKNNGVRAPNLLRLIERFNAVGDWVSSEILSADGRAGAMIAHFVDVADQLRKLNNFQATMAVLGGLGASAVTRLKEPWAELPAPKRELFDELSTLMSLSSNMKNLSEHLQTISPPAIPYVGLYLGHLTFIDEGNPNKLGELINFGKRRQVTATVFQLCRFQILAYELAELIEVQTYVDKFHRLSEDDAYAVSLLVAGRRAAELKVPRRWKALPLGFDEGVSRAHSFFADARQVPLALRDSAGRLQAATLSGFVAAMTDPASEDFGGAMYSAFLAFYRSLVSPRVLLLLLRARYQTPACKGAGERLEKYSAKVVQPLRQKVVRVLMTWIGKFWHDLFEHADAVSACRAFLGELNEPYMERMVQSLLQLLDAKEQQYAALVAARKALVFVPEPPLAPQPPQPPPLTELGRSASGKLSVSDARAEASLHDETNATLLGSSPETLARALAVLSWSAAQLVRPAELLAALSDVGGAALTSARQRLQSAWLDPAAAKLAPESLKPLLDLHHATRRWVAHVVLSGDTPQARCDAIKFFVALAQQLLALNDFAGVSAIVSSLPELCSPDVLPQTWSLLTSAELDALDALASKVSSSSDWRVYREHVRSSSVVPGVPLVAVLVHDLGEACGGALSETVASLADVEKSGGGGIVSSGSGNKSSGGALAQAAGSLSSYLPGATVAPPARVEQHSVVHVAAWMRAAPAATEFFAFQQAAYDAAPFASARALQRDVQLALERASDFATLRVRGEALSGDEQRQRIVATPLERDLSVLLDRLLGDPAASAALLKSTLGVQESVLAKHHESMRAQLARVEEKHASMLSMVEKRINAARDRLGELKADWDQPLAVGELLATAFPNAQVSFELVSDAAGAVYGWPCEMRLPIVLSASSTSSMSESLGGDGDAVGAAAMAAADGAPPTRLVALCPRQVTMAHVCAVLRVSPLVGAAPLIVTSECSEETRLVATEQGVRLVVI
jgi:hypothetical protein